MEGWKRVMNASKHKKHSDFVEKISNFEIQRKK